MAGNLEGVGFAGIVIKDGCVIRSGTKGATTSFKATCLTLPPLVAYHNYLLQGGASITAKGFDLGVDGITSSEEKWIEVSFPGLPTTLVGVINEWYMDGWELMTNEESDSIFANPLIVTNNPSLGSYPSPALNVNDKDVCIQLALYGGTVDQAVALADSNVPVNAPHSTPTSGPALQLILEILKGQVEYLAPTHVLRHTSYCSAGSTYNYNKANELRLYTTGQLLSEVGSGWNYNLPPRLYSVISSYPQQYAAADEAAYYTWSWLKKIGREPLQSDFMVEASTEYVLGLWSNLRYGLKS